MDKERRKTLVTILIKVGRSHAVDVMGYIFLAGIVIVTMTGGWVVYQDRKNR